MESQHSGNLKNLESSKPKSEESKVGLSSNSNSGATSNLTSSMRDLKRIDKPRGDDGCDQVTFSHKKQ